MTTWLDKLEFAVKDHAWEIADELLELVKTADYAVSNTLVTPQLFAAVWALRKKLEP